MEEENKKVTRRKFLEDSSRKALAGTAAAFLGLGMIKSKDVQAAAGCWVFGCMFGCSAACGSGCTGSCSGVCVGGCGGDCSTGCLEACLAGCRMGCATEEVAGTYAKAKYGTPVTEREASTRHVTV